MATADAIGGREGGGPQAGPTWPWAATSVLRWLGGAAPLEPAPAGPSDWRRLAERCGRLRVLPQMFFRLNESPEWIPSADAAEYSQRRLESLVRTTRGIQGGCRALHVLRSAGVPAVGFKGIAAVGWLHGGQPRRGVGDTDIAVSPDHADAAIEALLAAGFTPKVAGIRREEIVRFSRTSPGSAGNESLSLCGDDGTEIDVHWRLGGFDVPAMVTAARMIRVLADEVPLVRPGLGLLLAAHHSLRNDFVPDECLRDLLDAAGWMRLLAADAAESSWTEQEARRLGLDAAVGAFAIILAENGLHPPWERPPIHSTSTLLAELFRAQCESGPINTDLVYLCSIGPGWRLFQGLLGGGAGYIRAMRAMEAANREQQPGIAARLRRLAGDAWTVRWGRWRSLRALARCKDQAC
jgi:hypothetical protein